MSYYASTPVYLWPAPQVHFVHSLSTSNPFFFSMTISLLHTVCQLTVQSATLAVYIPQLSYPTAAVVYDGIFKGPLPLIIAIYTTLQLSPPPIIHATTSSNSHFQNNLDSLFAPLVHAVMFRNYGPSSACSIPPKYQIFHSLSDFKQDGLTKSMKEAPGRQFNSLTRKR